MRRGFCIYKGFCSRKNGEMVEVEVEGKLFPKCHVAGLVDCRYFIPLGLKPSERELVRLLK